MMLMKIVQAVNQIVDLALLRQQVVIRTEIVLPENIVHFFSEPVPALEFVVLQQLHLAQNTLQCADVMM